MIFRLHTEKPEEPIYKHRVYEFFVIHPDALTGDVLYAFHSFGANANVLHEATVKPVCFTIFLF